MSPRMQLSNAKLSFGISDADRLALSQATHPPIPPHHPHTRRCANCQPPPLHACFGSRTRDHRRATKTPERRRRAAVPTPAREPYL